MFSRGMRLFFTCGNNGNGLFVSRTYRNVRIKKHERKTRNDAVVKGNPGGNRMLAMILEGKSPDDSNVMLEDIEDGDNDMIDSHLFYDDYMEEIKKQKKNKSFYNIKRKYFKNNTIQPNFLTYFEKQQIKDLHAKSPKEWTPEILSSCFPATTEIIIKVLKSKWVADEGQQILRHDKTVKQNWERFRDGHYKDTLSDEIQNHLTKFAERRPTLITLEQAEAHVPKKASEYLKPEEFGQIITSYLGEPTVNQTEQIKIAAKEQQSTIKTIYENNTKTKTNKKHITLEEFKNNVQNESFSWYTPQSESTNETSIDIATVEAELRESTSVISRKEFSKYIDTINDYPLAIRIPAKAWKKGYTYKVKDCFYDDNGDFLYRVPGLIEDEGRQ